MANFRETVLELAPWVAAAAVWGACYFIPARDKTAPLPPVYQTLYGPVQESEATVRKSGEETYGTPLVFLQAGDETIVPALDLTSLADDKLILEVGDDGYVLPTRGPAWSDLKEGQRIRLRVQNSFYDRNKNGVGEASELEDITLEIEGKYLLCSRSGKINYWPECRFH